MDILLAGLEFAVAYNDDILLNIDNNEQHKEHKKAVFQKIDAYGFKLDSKKGKFFYETNQVFGSNGI